MLDLVGLEPGQFLARYPRHLSGGQRQRVGVARALAADPPVMLMDEPFGAVDPIVRAGCRTNSSASCARLRKTVIFVTHDIDEAIRMGDLIAIMRRTAASCSTTRPIGSSRHPADAFVADFVGADRALKRLSLITAGEAATAAPDPPGAPAVAASTSLRDVLSVLLASHADVAAVKDADGSVRGTVSLSAIRDRAAAPA